LKPSRSAAANIPLGDRTFEGKVARASWALDQMNRTLRVEIDAEDASGQLRPGMYAVATVLLGESENAVSLPSSAVFHDAGKAHCAVIEAGRIVLKPLTLGLKSRTDVEVLDGLTGNEKVVLKDAGALTAGQAVEAVEAPPAKK
jgi:multidrug efflux pump subunit AcrA (membrane-fusion protein)